MKLINPLEALVALPFFGQLPEACQHQVAGICRVRRVEAGEVVFAEGQSGEGAYVVMTGRVVVSKTGPDGKEQILKIWERGDLFGEVALWGDEPYPARAQMLGEGLLVFLPREALRAEILKHPELAFAIMRAMSERLRHLAGLVESLSLREVPMRLAAYLLDLSGVDEGERVELEITKSRLAATLGTIPETLSRAIAKMEKAGLIERDGAGAFRLVDRDGLAGLAAGRTRLK